MKTEAFSKAFKKRFLKDMEKQVLKGLKCNVCRSFLKRPNRKIFRRNIMQALRKLYKTFKSKDAVCARVLPLRRRRSVISLFSLSLDVALITSPAQYIILCIIYIINLKVLFAFSHTVHEHKTIGIYRRGAEGK
jgi:hypothetical protein